MNNNITIKELLFVSLFSLLCILFFTFPSVLHLSDKYIGDGEDNYEYASYQQLAVKNVSEGSAPFTTTTFWRYPIGFNFERGFDSFLTVTTGTVLGLIFAFPLAYNLTLYFLMLLNTLCTYVLFKTISKTRLIAFIGVTMYAFSFYALAKVHSHPNLLFIGGFTLFLYMLLQIIKKKTPTFLDFLLLFLSGLLIAVGSLLYFVLFLLFLFIYVIFFILTSHNSILLLRNKLISSFPTAGLAFAIVFFLFLILFHPHLIALLTSTYYTFDREKILYELTPSLFDFFLPNSYIPLLLGQFVASPSSPSIAKAVFLGFAELTLFVCFFLSNVGKHIKKIVAFSFLLPFLLSLGYGKDNSFFLLPYNFLKELPLFSIIVEPGRYFVIFYLVATIAVILFLNTISEKKKLLALILVVLFLERIPYNFKLSQVPEKEAYTEVVKSDTASAAVLDIPVDIYSRRYNMLSFLYEKPIVNGYFHWSADGPAEKSFVLGSSIDRYTCQPDTTAITVEKLNSETESIADKRMLSLLRQQGIRTIVVHTDDKFYHPVCTNVRVRLSRLLPLIQPVEVTPENKQQKLYGKSYDGTPSFTLYFPYPGTFYLDGAYIAPTNDITVSIYFNNTVPPFSYYWETDKSYGMQLQPQYTTALQVDAGSVLTFYSNDYSTRTELSLWYRYLPSSSYNIPFNPQIKKLYEDENTTVYRIQ